MAVTENLELFKHDEPLATNEEQFNIKKALNDNFDILDGAVGDLQDKVIEHDEHITAMRKDIADIQKEQTAQDTNIENLQKSVETNTKSIQTLDNDVRANADAITENTSDIKDLQAENTALKEELEKQKEDNKLNGLTEDNEGELVHIENTTGARFNSLEIFGNEKQETREGKNLYNVYDTEGRNFNSTLLKIDDEDKISLEDYTNSSDTTKWIDFNTNISQKIKASTVYYVVTEIFSVSGSGNLTVVSTNASAPGQFATSVSYNFSALAAGDVKIAQITSREDLSNCVSMLRSFLQFTAGQGGSISFRVSVLEKSVTAEDFKYEKYGESPSFYYPSEVKAVENSINLKICNKNFLEITAENQTLNGIAIDIVGNRVTLNGTATKDFEFDLAKNFYLPAKNMFVSFKEEGSVDAVNCTYSLRNADNKQLLGYNKIGSSTNKTIVANDLGNNMKFFAFWITQGTVFTNFAVEIQIEAGASATDIVANEQQEHVVPVQQKMFSKDKFDLKKKKEVHSMKKIVLDGVYYVWGVKAIGSGSVVQFGINLGFTAKENPLAISNYFKKETNYSVVNTFVIASNLKTAYFHIPADSIEEVSTTTLQKKLKELYDAGNPVELWVEAEEPDELDLTEEQIAVLEQIEQATTYKEVTNVYTTDEIGAIIKTNTNVDLSTIINNVVEAQLSQIGG